MAAACTDRLDALLNHFPVRAHLFHAGALCGITDFDAPDHGGQLHLVRGGALDVVHPGSPPLQIREPSLLLYPRPMARRFISDAVDGAVTTCANLHFEGGTSNPIAGALPDVLCLPLAGIDGLDRTLALLFEEASSEYCGRREMIDRLFEVALIQVLRHLMETGRLEGGMLAGMSHPKLRKALVAIHEQPAVDWSLERLGEIAGMSRSAFATAFHDTLGCTPGAYLQAWRVRLTQKALRKGQPLKLIAADVGYGSEAALSRAFKAQSGMSPREWRQSQPA
ncbi:MAG: cupin domain-containing protein [Sinimarinibacterium flocculans]|uniref:AraC family transcriptional regulator n=1 Tax=Sinimarinibacterium flocculans TaxID=985250 RepID=UPI003C63F494